MLLVDTNVFVYAADRSFPEHAKCLSLVTDLRSRHVPWHTTWPIIYEFLNVVTHRRFGPRSCNLPDAWRFMDSILTSRSLAILAPTDRHISVAREVFASVPSLRGAILHDAHTAILMREHGISRIYTRDTAFHRFPFLDVLDPLTEKYRPEGGPGSLGVSEPRSGSRRKPKRIARKTKRAS